MYDNWKKYKLRQLVIDMGDGGTPDTNKKEYFDGAIPWAVIQDIRSEIFDTKTKLTEKGLASCSAKLWPTGSVILSTGATIGEVGIAKVPLATKQGITGIVCKPKLLNQFLYYKLQFLKDYLKAYSQGSTIKEIRVPFLSEIEILLPPIEEQTQIANILATIDKAIEQTEAIIAKQQRIKTGLMQDLLTRGIDEHGNIRSEATHKFKDSPLGRIPVEWEVERLAIIVKEPITYGIVQAGPHIEDGIPYIRTGDMAGDYLTLAGLMRTSSTIANRYKRSEVHTGDIVFALRATVGKVLLVPPELDGANLTQGTAKISPNETTNNLFLLWMMRSRPVIKQIKMFEKGTTFKEISLTNLREILIAIPKSVDEQIEIAKTLNFQERLIHSEHNNYEKYTSIKRGLMQDLLTGKVRVTQLLDT